MGRSLVDLFELRMALLKAYIAEDLDLVQELEFELEEIHEKGADRDLG